MTSQIEDKWQCGTGKKLNRAWVSAGIEVVRDLLLYASVGLERCILVGKGTAHNHSRQVPQQGREKCLYIMSKFPHPTRVSC